jgi:hypothetical protein
LKKRRKKKKRWEKARFGAAVFLSVVNLSGGVHIQVSATGHAASACGERAVFESNAGIGLVHRSYIDIRVANENAKIDAALLDNNAKNGVEGRRSGAEASDSGNGENAAGSPFGTVEES